MKKNEIRKFVEKVRHGSAKVREIEEILARSREPVEPPKRGRGRPKLDTASPTVALTVRLTERQLAELDRLLAASTWMKSRADAVRFLVDECAPVVAAPPLKSKK